MTGEPNYFHFKNGVCINCGQTSKEVSCSAKKYTAFKDNEGHVFHFGKHACQPVPIKRTKELSKIVKKTLSVEPYVTPAKIQSAAILDALRNDKPLIDVMKIVDHVTDTRLISNEIAKNKNEWIKGDSKFVAIQSFKERLEKQADGKFLIYSG